MRSEGVSVSERSRLPSFYLSKSAVSVDGPAQCPVHRFTQPGPAVADASDCLARLNPYRRGIGRTESLQVADPIGLFLRPDEGEGEGPNSALR